MDCGKFGDCSFSRFGSVMQTDTQTHRQTDVDERLTHTTLIGASNNRRNLLSAVDIGRSRFTAYRLTHR